MSSAVARDEKKDALAPNTRPVQSGPCQDDDDNNRYGTGNNQARPNDGQDVTQTERAEMLWRLGKEVGRFGQSLLRFAAAFVFLVKNHTAVVVRP